MNKLVVYGIVGGLVYWFLLKPKAMVPPITATTPIQPQINNHMNPQIMVGSNPSNVAGVSMYNEETYPIGTFAN